jgi:hypothetical protein
MAASRGKQIRTNPELTRQLDAAKGTDQVVEAVLMMKQSGANANLTTKQAREIAESVIERVERDVGVSPSAVNVLENLGVLVIAAEEPFVRQLIEQPEFDSAAANSNTQDASPKVAKKTRKRRAAPKGRTKRRTRAKANS